MTPVQSHHGAKSDTTRGRRLYILQCMDHMDDREEGPSVMDILKERKRDQRPILYFNN